MAEPAFDKHRTPRYTSCSPGTSPDASRHHPMRRVRSGKTIGGVRALPAGERGPGTTRVPKTEPDSPEEDVTDNNLPGVAQHVPALRRSQAQFQCSYSPPVAKANSHSAFKSTNSRRPNSGHAAHAKAPAKVNKSENGSPPAAYSQSDNDDDDDDDEGKLAIVESDEERVGVASTSMSPSSQDGNTTISSVNANRGSSTDSSTNISTSSSPDLTRLPSLTPIPRPIPLRQAGSGLESAAAAAPQTNISATASAGGQLASMLQRSKINCQSTDAGMSAFPTQTPASTTSAHASEGFVTEYAFTGATLAFPPASRDQEVPAVAGSSAFPLPATSKPAVTATVHTAAYQPGASAFSTPLNRTSSSANGNHSGSALDLVLVKSASDASARSVDSPPPSTSVRSPPLGPLGPCVVCGEDSSGKHFGVITCEACKSFFRRSVRRSAKLNYMCMRQGQCKVESSRRTTCQACRFHKCIEAGMQPDLVQDPRCPQVQRGPTGSTSGMQAPSSSVVRIVVNPQPVAHTVPVYGAREWRGKVYQPPTAPPATVAATTATAAANAGKNNSNNNNGSSSSVGAVDAGAAAEVRTTGAPGNQPSLPPLIEMGVARTKPASAVPINIGALRRSEQGVQAALNSQLTQKGMELLDSLVKVDNELRQQAPARNGHLGVKFIKDRKEILSLFREQVVQIARWAYLLPRFRAIRLIDDQVKVLAESWHNVLVFRLSQLSQPNLDDMVVIQGAAIERRSHRRSSSASDTEGSSEDDETTSPGAAECREVVHLREIMDSVADPVIVRARGLRMCRLERACLCGMLLFDPDPHLNNGTSQEVFNSLHSYQNALMSELYDLCQPSEQLYPVKSSSAERGSGRGGKDSTIDNGGGELSVPPECKFYQYLVNMKMVATSLQGYLKQHFTLFGKEESFRTFLLGILSAVHAANTADTANNMPPRTGLVAKEMLQRRSQQSHHAE
eukprot:scpid55510/ scgid21723/ Nuclear receptor subfamily 2 group F member 6; V-erbA-related protein 2